MSNAKCRGNVINEESLPRSSYAFVTDGTYSEYVIHTESLGSESSLFFTEKK